MPDWMVETAATVASALAALALAVIGIVAKTSKRKTKRKSNSNSAVPTMLWNLLAGAVVLSAVFQGLSSYRRHHYNSDLVLRFEDKYDSKKQERSEAATALTEFSQKKNWEAVTNNTDGLDEVLGLFDELGFYWKSGQISSVVLHEHFFDDIRIYCQNGTEYIDKAQKEEGTATFEYVLPLFDELMRVESERSHKPIAECRLNDKLYSECLQSEIRLHLKK